MLILSVALKTNFLYKPFLFLKLSRLFKYNIAQADYIVIANM